MTIKSRLWISRALVGLVLFINLQCALAFLSSPAGFAPAYELSDVPGTAAIRALAVLFLMWNVPYVVAFSNPIKYRLSLYEALAMQSLGLIGETYIWMQVPPEFTVLRSSIVRFILFDGFGLLALATAAWLIGKQNKNLEEVLE